MELTPLALVRRDGILPQARLVEALAGEPVRGSWWGHPKGKIIFAATQVLAESPDVLTTRLGGRVTWVHRDVWPLLARVVQDPVWRAKAIAALSDEARALLAEVERGEVRNPPKKPREALEARLLVAAEQVHEGHHVVILRPWRCEPAACSLEEALGELRRRGATL